MGVLNSYIFRKLSLYIVMRRKKVRMFQTFFDDQQQRAAVCTKKKGVHLFDVLSCFTAVHQFYGRAPNPGPGSSGFSTPSHGAQERYILRP